MEYRPILDITKRFLQFLSNEINIYYGNVSVSMEMKVDEYFRGEKQLKQLIGISDYKKKKGMFYQAIVSFEKYELEFGDYIPKIRDKKVSFFKSILNYIFKK